MAAGEVPGDGRLNGEGGYVAHDDDREQRAERAELGRYQDPRTGDGQRVAEQVRDAGACSYRSGRADQPGKPRSAATVCHVVSHGRGPYIDRARPAPPARGKRLRGAHAALPTG